MLLKIDDTFIRMDRSLLKMSDPVSVTKHIAMYKIEDIYSMVQPDERIVIITRHAERGSFTGIEGDLNSNGILQCKALGASLSNPNINLAKTYIGGSHKYRALNTAYQVTKAMGVDYPSEYNYLTDTDAYDELMEINFFIDSDGNSSGIDLDVNAYYSYIDDTIYNGANKVDNHVNTKAQGVIDLILSKAADHDADLSWFGTHDKVIIPLLAYVTDRTSTLHNERKNADVTIKMKNPITSAQSGNWSIPYLSGIAFIVNKNTGDVNIYPVDAKL